MIVLSAVSIRNAGPLKVLKSAILDLSLKYDNLYVVVGDDTILSDTDEDVIEELNRRKK